MALDAHLRPAYEALDAICPPLGARYRGAVAAAAQTIEDGPWCCMPHFELFIDTTAHALRFVDRMLAHFKDGKLKRRVLLKFVRAICEGLETPAPRVDMKNIRFVQDWGQA